MACKKSLFSKNFLSVASRRKASWYLLMIDIAATMSLGIPCPEKTRSKFAEPTVVDSGLSLTILRMRPSKLLAVDAPPNREFADRYVVNETRPPGYPA